MFAAKLPTAMSPAAAIIMQARAPWLSAREESVARHSAEADALRKMTSPADAAIGHNPLFLIQL